jgi:energy-coupling factor transporter ATP-binding protein EcfA2
MENPFTPSTHIQLPSYISNRPEVSSLQNFIDNSHRFGETIFVLGHRGSGKTSLLAHLKSNISRRDRYFGVWISSNKDLLEMLYAKLHQRLLAEYELDNVRLNMFGFEINFKQRISRTTLLIEIERLLLVAKKLRVCVILFLDEVHRMNADLRQLLSSAPVWGTDGLPIKIIAAGLPMTIDTVMNDQVLTFLLRAERVILEPFNQKMITERYLCLFGKRLSAFEAIRMAQMSRGIPYLYQMIGWQVWEAVGENVSSEVVNQSIEVAKEKFFSTVYRMAYSDLPMDYRAFIEAVYHLGGRVTELSEVEKRAGFSDYDAWNIRESLIDWGLIVRDAEGKMTFNCPYFMDFLSQSLGETS